MIGSSQYHLCRTAVTEGCGHVICHWCHHLKLAVGLNLIYTNIQISTEKFLHHCIALILNLLLSFGFINAKWLLDDNGGWFLSGDKTLDSPPQQESIWRLSEAGAGRDSLPPLYRTLMETTRDLHRITATCVLWKLSLESGVGLLAV